MKKFIAEEYGDPEARERVIRDNCDKIEKKSYMRNFTPDELLAMKDQLSDVAIQINDIEEAKKEAVAEFKRKLDPLVDTKKSLLNNLKNKAESVNEEVYKYTDVHNKEVGYYTKEGRLIESRPAYANELQGNIFQLSVANE